MSQAPVLQTSSALGRFLCTGTEFSVSERVDFCPGISTSIASNLPYEAKGRAILTLSILQLGSPAIASIPSPLLVLSHLILTLSLKAVPKLATLANGRLENLPSCKETMTLCRQAGYDTTGIPFRSQPCGPVVAWIKYGPNVTVGEAYTQDWVAKFLNAEPEADMTVPRVYMAFTNTHSIGYVVMEFIDAPDCTSRDVKLVAQAVKKFTSIRDPSPASEHVGGGHAAHTFFADDRTAPFPYVTVKARGAR
ncbi:hypothetical protein BOTBODRAFT_46041 [Botryobasidium botryosum FD-172 SS1]|uniref:Aminoglycoside phosphotransferase domain-containing protein n=1 Tax=Botryobasidium botryosum (strain FD-172 SS1) TaxID=930990 RepID=A0A067M8W0_BOTB1|nr:hypothetical protein BOTBODRAFT_46041 [Botryobasidium botryosum FD-172 SS1]